jgi:hypothetical protein
MQKNTAGGIPMQMKRFLFCVSKYNLNGQNMDVFSIYLRRPVAGRKWGCGYYFSTAKDTLLLQRFNYQV